MQRKVSSAVLRARYREYVQRTAQRTHEVMSFDRWLEGYENHEADDADGFDDPDDTLERDR